MLCFFFPHWLSYSFTPLLTDSSIRITKVPESKWREFQYYYLLSIYDLILRFFINCYVYLLFYLSIVYFIKLLSQNGGSSNNIVDTFIHMIQLYSLHLTITYIEYIIYLFLYFILLFWATTPGVPAPLHVPLYIKQFTAFHCPPYLSLLYLCTGLFHLALEGIIIYFPVSL